jgi:hypothetical protein
MYCDNNGFLSTTTVWLQGTDDAREVLEVLGGEGTFH